MAEQIIEGAVNSEAPVKRKAGRKARTPKAQMLKTPSPIAAKSERSNESDLGSSAAEQRAEAASAVTPSRRKPGRPRVEKPQVAQTTHTENLDGLADLIQLEEENKRLRVLLAEKLRGENDELRKRLGMN